VSARFAVTTEYGEVNIAESTGMIIFAK
jgi:hypothetical protein